MAVSIANEYLAWDNVETVYVTTHVNGEPQPRKPINYALRVNPQDKRSSYQGARTTARETTFWLPVAEFGTKEPDGSMILERTNATRERYRLLDSRLVSLGSSDSHWDVLMAREQDEL